MRWIAEFQEPSHDLLLPQWEGRLGARPHDPPDRHHGESYKNLGILGATVQYNTVLQEDLRRVGTGDKATVGCMNTTYGCEFWAPPPRVSAPLSRHAHSPPSAC